MYLYRQSGRLTWQVRWWQNGVKRQVSTGTSDRIAAERVVLALRDAIGRKADAARVERLLLAAYPERRVRGLPLADIADAYMGASVQSEHIRLSAQHWRRFVAYCATRPAMELLADVDAATCRAFAASLTDCAPKTASNIVSSCGRVWRAVAPLHGVTADPWQGIRMSHAGTPGRALTTAECEALVRATAGTEYGLAIVIALYTGLRYGDVARLTWEEIDGDVIRRKPGKTARFGIVVTVPLHARVRAALPPRGVGPVMPSLAAVYGTWRDGEFFADACKAAGIERKGITFHSLRHTFITRLAEAGVPEDVRRRLAGHSNAVTHDRYSHDAEAQRRAVDALPGV